MVGDDPRLMRLAGAVADGTPVDWARVLESTPDPALREAVQQLQVIAGLTSVHWARDDPSAHDTVEPAPMRQSWGPLELRRMIGKGTFGTVYLAWDPSLEREVAVKILNASQRTDAVIREGRLLARIRHPHVVTVYGTDQFDGAVGLWMEFVDGVTLKQLLNERGAFGAHEAALIGIDVCRAVAAVHQAGLLHRDIKSQNVMREAGGRIVLMDLGAGEVQTTQLQMEPRLTGTPLYLAPELIAGGRATVASDVYSVGVLLYHLLTKRFPVEGETIAALEAEHARHRRMPLSDLRPDLPAGIISVIERALDPDPARRYRSAGAMQQELLRTITPDAAPSEKTADDVGVKRRPAVPWRAVALAIGVLAIAAAATVWYGSGSSRPFLLGSPRQLTTWPGWESEPAIGPDGHLIAYTSDQGGNSDIWLLDVLTGASLRLTDDPAVDRSPTWLPDGSAVLFVSNRDGKTSIWKTPRLGGPAVMVLDNAEDPAVSPDGARLAFARRDATGQYRIHVAALAGSSNARALTTASSGLYDHRHPAWSPDGQRIVYNGLRDLWIVSATDAKTIRLTADDAADRDPVWSPDGAFIYFDSDKGGTRVIWRVPATGGRPVPLTGGQGPERYPNVSKDGLRLVYSTLEENRDLILRELQSGQELRLGSDRMELSPIFSPDGNSLAFVSDRWAGRYDLWSQPLTHGAPTGEPRRLTDQTGSIAAPAYSPDGRWIAYYRVTEGQRDIWVVSANGGSPIQFTNDPAVDVHPDWSPDGRHLVFASEREDGYQIWRQPIVDGRPAAAAQRLTKGPPVAGAPKWSPDGASIAYVGGDADVWLVAADASTPPRRVTKGATVSRLAWNRANADLWVSANWGADVPSIRIVDVKTGDARSPKPPIVQSRTTPPDFDLSWDGRWIGFTVEVLRGDLWVREAAAKTF